MSLDKITAAIRDIPDFPKPGIIFKDITPLLQDPVLFQETIERLCIPWKNAKPDLIVGIDARGFIFGAVMAHQLNAGFIPIRKQGKLPWQSLKAEYELEYGANTMEMHIDAIKKRQKVLIVDDLLATGGTARAAIELVEQAGGYVIGIQALVELTFLKPRKKLGGCRVNSLIMVE